MIKKILAVAALTMTFTATTVLCADGPSFLFKMNPDGTTDVSFTVSAGEMSEDINQEIESYREMGEQQGYNVEAAEDGASIIFSKTTPAEEGYVFDTTPIGAPLRSFVVINGLFRTEHVFVNHDFDFTQYGPSGDGEGVFCTITAVTPARAGYTTATRRDDAAKTYTWDVKVGETNEIVLIFYKYNYGAVAATVVIAAALALLCLLLFRKKKSFAGEEYTAPVIEEAVVDPESEIAVVNEFFDDVDTDELIDDEEFSFDEPDETTSESNETVALDDFNEDENN